MARFVTTARFVTNEVVTNRASIASFFLTWISVHVILYVSRVCVCVCVCVFVLHRIMIKDYINALMLMWIRNSRIGGGGGVCDRLGWGVHFPT